MIERYSRLLLLPGRLGAGSIAGFPTTDAEIEMLAAPPDS
jgi:hypothetical protein